MVAGRCGETDPDSALNRSPVGGARLSDTEGPAMLAGPVCVPLDAVLEDQDQDDDDQNQDDRACADVHVNPPFRRLRYPAYRNGNPRPTARPRVRRFRQARDKLVVS